MGAIKKLITDWKLNKVIIASKMGMNAYTFKMKLSGKYPAYYFTDAELIKLKAVLCDLGADISNL